MKRTLRAAMSLILAVIFAAPAFAQVAIPPAEKGDLVDVTLRDGRELRGVVGNWMDDGFYVIPEDGARRLIHPGDIATLRLANNHAIRTPPVKPRHRMSGDVIGAVAAGAAIGVYILVRMMGAGR